jgi:5-keto 4-deoxyuronate isomerase
VIPDFVMYCLDVISDVIERNKVTVGTLLVFDPVRNCQVAMGTTNFVYDSVYDLLPKIAELENNNFFIFFCFEKNVMILLSPVLHLKQLSCPHIHLENASFSSARPLREYTVRFA